MTQDQSPRQSWPEHFMAMAEFIAQRSKDTTKVGCVIIHGGKHVISSGYNGLPMGVDDLPKRMERPAKYLWTSHAEENAVAQAARYGISCHYAIAYVTHHPCSRCARMLIQAGISAVVHGLGETHMPDEEFEVAQIMFKEARVRYYNIQSLKIIPARMPL